MTRPMQQNSTGRRGMRAWTVGLIALPVILAAGVAAAQSRPAPQARSSQVAIAGPISDKDTASIQEELIRLLRLSPTLTTVVARDPSLLSDQEYVKRNNPQLAQFLENHPEVALNPDFYLFTHLNVDGHPDQALEHEVWPDLPETRQGPPYSERMVSDFAPILAFAGLAFFLIWLIRQFLENRRWGRVFKLQSDVHGKLIDRMSSNEDLATYMSTEAGKRFLEGAPIPIDFEQQRLPGAVARVLTPLQIGIVLSLLGLGFFMLRHTQTDMETPMLVLGTVVLMPGLGFILSAGVAWLLAGRLGLMPDPPASNRLASRFDPTGPMNPTDRQ